MALTERNRAAVLRVAGAWADSICRVSAASGGDPVERRIEQLQRALTLLTPTLQESDRADTIELAGAWADTIVASRAPDAATSVEERVTIFRRALDRLQRMALFPNRPPQAPLRPETQRAPRVPSPPPGRHTRS